MFKASFALLVALVMAAPATVQAKETPNNGVVAIVNGDKILKEDVLGAMKALAVKAEDAEKAFPVVVDQIINEKLIDNETVKSNISADPEFQQRLAKTKAQLIKSMYLERYLADKMSEQKVKAEYNKFKKEHKGKQEVRARHILVNSEEEAKQAIKDLDGGAKFEEIAAQRSSGPTAKNGGDVGYFAKGEIIPAFSDAAFKLKPGTYTKTPIKSEFGWHVIYVEDKRSRVVPEMKEVEAAIRNKMGQDAIETLVKTLRAKADIKRFGPDGQPLDAEAVKKN